MLEITDLSVSYGKIEALRGVSLRVGDGEVVTVIGSNGAGKTTTLMTVSGLLRPRDGSVVFDGTDLTRLSPDQIVQHGVVHCPEGRLIFGRLTVAENLALGAYHRRKGEAVGGDRDRVYELFPVLGARRSQRAGTLSGGEQQMLAIGRSLMSRPRLLLLDEPSLGLAPLLVEQIFDVVGQLRQEGVTLLLVEQNAQEALNVSDRGYVLESGQIRTEGPSGQLVDDPQLRSAYLGG